MDDGKPGVVIRAAPESPAPLPAWVIAICVVFALQIPIVSWFVVPQFREVFTSFGAELPMLTRIFVNAPWIGVLWPLAIGLDAARLRARGRGGLLSFVLRAIFGTCALFMLIVLAMYLPIFSLAATV